MPLVPRPTFRLPFLERRSGALGARTPGSALTDDDVVWLLEGCQAGTATAAECAALGWWILEVAHRRLLRAGYTADGAEDLALEVFTRVWRSIVDGHFRL